MRPRKKIALVFGGSRGIGAACVQNLATSGFDVAYTYKANPACEATNSTAYIYRVEGYRVEITDAAQVAQVFEKVHEDFGGAPNCVVANAGINVLPAPVAEFDHDSFRRLVEINIIGAFNVLHAAARQVAHNGCIIAITTSLVRFAVPGLGPYSATKAAVECLVRSMSKELAGRGVRVNAVAPGPIDTDLFRAGKDEAAIRRSASLSPFDRVGQPQEVSEVVNFLASDKASWVNGQIIQPNGGMA